MWVAERATISEKGIWYGGRLLGTFEWSCCDTPIITLEQPHFKGALKQATRDVLEKELGMIAGWVKREYLTDEVVGLVETICSDFKADHELLAILSDALENNGLVNDFVLAHLKTYHNNVNGCNVIEDLRGAINKILGTHIKKVLVKK